MPNLSWVAAIVFNATFFIAWASNELPHTTWLTVAAIAALVYALALLLFNAYPYVNRQHPQA